MIIDWLESIYFPTNLKRLREQLEMVIDWLEKNGLSYVKPGGGLYIYVNFSKVSNHVLVSLEVVLFNIFIVVL